MDELAPGLHHWTAPHPEWEEGDSWPREVSSYAWNDGERLTLIDPLAVPQPLLDRIPERDTAIVLTVPWHERESRSLVERFGIPVITPSPDSADDIMAKYAVGPERAGNGSDDLAWLLDDGGAGARLYQAGDDLGRGITAKAGSERNDLLLWVEGPRALVSGDTLVDLGGGTELWSESLGHRVPREQVLASLRELLALPVERVLLTHGGPVDRAALVRALA